jgi:hypothetical protein
MFTFKVTYDPREVDLAMAATKARLGRIVATAALNVETTAKQEIQDGGKSGVIYRRHGREHQASAPGQAPATDLGDLVNSIGAQSTDDPLQWEVIVGSAHGEPLETGTIHMAPRPFLQPAVDQETPAFRRAIENVLQV